MIVKDRVRPTWAGHNCGLLRDAYGQYGQNRHSYFGIQSSYLSKNPLHRFPRSAAGQTFFSDSYENVPRRSCCDLFKGMCGAEAKLRGAEKSNLVKK